MTKQKIVPCLWCDGNSAEEAAALYLSVFPDAREIDRVPYGPDQPAPEGTVMLIELELAGQRFTLLNGGETNFPFTEGVSFQVFTADQEETDRYWDGLLEGGGQEGPCGWLKDRFGLSWQVTPEPCTQMLSDPDPARRARAASAMFGMRKMDIEQMRAAADDPDYEVRPWNAPRDEATSAG